LAAFAIPGKFLPCYILVRVVFDPHQSPIWFKALCAHRPCKTEGSRLHSSLHVKNEGATLCFSQVEKADKEG